MRPRGARPPARPVGYLKDTYAQISSPFPMFTKFYVLYRSSLFEGRKELASLTLWESAEAFADIKASRMLHSAFSKFEVLGICEANDLNAVQDLNDRFQSGLLADLF